MCAQPDGAWFTAYITCMRFFLLYTGVMLQPNIIIHVKVKQWPAFASGLGDDQIIEGHVVGQDQVLLDIHEIADRCGPR